MKEAITLIFEDVETSDEAVAIVRYDESSVALGLSLKSDGDIEVFMTKDNARSLMEALKAAVD